MRGSVPMALAFLLVADSAAPALARFHLSSPTAATTQCIKLHSIRDESAEDDTKLLFHVGGSRIYRNILPKPCDNLRRINDLGKLRLHPTSEGQLCKGDKIEVSDSGSVLGAVGLSNDTGTTRMCTLGDFEGISEMTVTEELRR